MSLQAMSLLNWFLLALLLMKYGKAEPDVDSNSLDDVIESHRELKAITENKTEVQNIVKDVTDVSNTSIVFDSGRQFPGILETIAGFGPLGYQLSSILNAIFFEPPLGPIFCRIFGNCRTSEEELDGRSFEDMGPVLNMLWKTYQNYNRPVAASTK